MILLKISSKKYEGNFRKIGKYFIYFNGDYIKDESTKKVYLKLKENLIGIIDYNKAIIEIYRPWGIGLPMYYYFKKSNELVFSSHISSFKDDNLKLKEEPSSVAELISYGYILPPKTIYKNIMRVPLSMKCVIHLNNKLNLICRESFNISDRETDSQKIINYIEKNIKFERFKRFTLFFSGGLDSSILCSLMKKQRVKFNLISTGFEFSYQDLIEKNYSLSASRAFNKKTDYLTFDFNNLITLIPEIILITEEPISHIQTLLIYALMKYNQNKINPCIINGQGADGIFGTVSQFNFISSRTKLLLPKVNIERFNFLGKEYVHNYKKNKLLFLKILKKYNLLNKNLLIDLNGDVDVTMNSWTKCANHFSFSIEYPLFQKSFFEKMRVVDWKVKSSEPKFFLKQLARKNKIAENIISRKKCSFGPISESWGIILLRLIPVVYPYFNKDELNIFFSNNKNRYVLWNILNYIIWKKIFIEGETPSQIGEYLRKLVNHEN